MEIAHTAFCRGCGNGMVSDAAICIKCGRAVKTLATQEEWPTGLFLLFFIIGGFIPFLGWAVGIYGILKESTRIQGIIVFTTSTLAGFGWYLITH